MSSPRRSRIVVAALLSIALGALGVALYLGFIRGLP